MNTSASFSPMCCRLLFFDGCLMSRSSRGQGNEALWSMDITATLPMWIEKGVRQGREGSYCLDFDNAAQVWHLIETCS